MQMLHSGPLRVHTQQCPPLVTPYVANHLLLPKERQTRQDIHCGWFTLMKDLSLDQQPLSNDAAITNENAAKLRMRSSVKHIGYVIHPKLTSSTSSTSQKVAKVTLRSSPTRTFSSATICTRPPQQQLLSRQVHATVLASPRLDLLQVPHLL